MEVVSYYLRAVSMQPLPNNFLEWHIKWNESTMIDLVAALPV